MLSASGTVGWHLTDHLESVREIVANNASVLATATYDGFGVANTISAIGDYQWTGRQFDSETGLQYNRERYYDPKTGRWISEDPLGFDAGDSNLYRYVNNQFTEATEPAGKRQTRERLVFIQVRYKQLGPAPLPD